MNVEDRISHLVSIDIQIRTFSSVRVVNLFLNQ